MLVTTNILTDIIQRCHQRREKPLRQRRTIVTPAPYTVYPFQFNVYCAHRCPVLLNDLEEADISFMPIGRAPEYDRGPRDFGGTRFLERQGTADWRMRLWRASWGMGVYTGTPSKRDGASWHDIDFKYEALCAAPDATLACIEALVNAVRNPLLTLSKSGGLRFSCRVLDYLHPSTQETQQYIYKHNPTLEDRYHRDVFLEVLGEEGLSCWDARYEILLGNLLEPPVISQEVLFAPIDVLRAVFHEPVPSGENGVKSVATAPPTLGSYNLELAKEAFLKRGFSYAGRENISHLWTQHADPEQDVQVSLWEDEGIVWVCAATPHAGLPTTSTPITDIWDDTGILQPPHPAGSPVSDKILDVREGKLSPLAIKRPSPILQKPESPEKVEVPLEKYTAQIQDVLDRNTPILGFTTETGFSENSQIESYLLKRGMLCLNRRSPQRAYASEKYFQAEKVPSVVRWKPRMYLWEQAKDIPVDVRMETPFQQGNVCEDPERCVSLEEKGGNPSESICPECPVYTQCQQEGYLSQFSRFQDAEVQIAAIPQLFFNPQYAEMLDGFLHPSGETERFCMIDAVEVHELFLNCHLSKEILEAWTVDWQGQVLGNFANFLLNNLELKDQPDSGIVKRVRSAIQAFEQQAEEIARQMCLVNVLGKVVPRGVVDSETGEELARFSIEFQNGAAAYIPVNDKTTDKLATQRLPFFPLDSFVLNERMRIPMSITQAIKLGVLDTTTVENIQGFPTVCRDSTWTFWHQLKRFFAHYTRDADAPMFWDREVLRFWVPPVLHQSVNPLMLVSSTPLEHHLRAAFPDQDIEGVHTEPAAWLQGNQVFQIRTGTYPIETILDYDKAWNGVSLSKIGRDLFLGIHAEIERDPNVKHVIITYRTLTQYLKDILADQNACGIIDFKYTGELESTFEDAQTIWIVGTPRWGQSTFWRRSQMLFGNHETPLSYDEESGAYAYKDERVQSVYEQNVVGLLKKIVGQTGLHRSSGKRIVLVSSVPLPGITDRPETLLFDWEDFLVAGTLDGLPEVIATRQHFEIERDNLTANASRTEVERVLGCSPRQANRVLKKLRGGRNLRVPFREQTLSLLANGEKTTAELVHAIEGHPKAINSELTRLVKAGEIRKVRRGLYALPQA